MKQVMLMIKLAVLVICTFSILALTGCSKVNKENYDKIKIGMSYEEVVGILGNPDTCEERTNPAPIFIDFSFICISEIGQEGLIQKAPIKYSVSRFKIS